jgi:hypothetical protein
MALVLAAGAANGLAQSDDSGSLSSAGVNGPKLDLTAAQRSAIYAAVSKDRSKVAPQRFPPVVGAEVPPMIELYALPDSAAAANPAVKFYQYTMVQNQVVLVDPIKMRVIDVIGPEQRQ